MASRDCVFCSRLAAHDDVDSLILHRAEHAFVIMNRYPYNTGHVMMVPDEHVASPEQADEHGLQTMASLLPPALRALRRVLGCHGFNVGFNVGADAGAGVADHLHQHVVPRWQGDANFMPILAETMVLPEVLPVTYAKIRAELRRELLGTDRVTCVAVDPNANGVLAVETADGWRLPVATGKPGEPLWRSATRLLTDLTGGEAMVVGAAVSPAPDVDADADASGLVLSVAKSLASNGTAGSTTRWLAREEISVLGPDAGMAADFGPAAEGDAAQ